MIGSVGCALGLVVAYMALIVLRSTVFAAPALHRG